jgi:hypothetical protein
MDEYEQEDEEEDEEEEEERKKEESEEEKVFTVVKLRFSLKARNFFRRRLLTAS